MTDDHDPLDFPGQNRAAAENADEERRQRQKELSDLCKVMGSKEGRRFMYRLLSEAGVYRSSFSTDLAQMAFNEGNRNFGLTRLGELMEACPQQYALMLNEAKDENERRTNNRRADRR